jgi:hypothetical protein
MSEGDGEKRAGREAEGAEFKVTDRRLFTATGEPRREIQEEAEEAGRTAAPETRSARPGFERHPVNEPEGVDFTMLVTAMAQPALVYLGEVPHPGTGEPTIDLEQAKIQIDMLGLLGTKCRGNLEPAEEKLLERVLYQLRMSYVARSSRTG